MENHNLCVQWLNLNLINHHVLKRFIIIFLLLHFSLATAIAQQHSYLFSQLRSTNGLVSDEVMGVQQDSLGYIWIATLSGIQRYDGRRFLSFHHNEDDPHSIPNDRAHWINLDKKGRMWFMFNENKVGWFNVHDLSFHEVPIRSDNSVISTMTGHIFIDRQQKIMLAFYPIGLFSYNESTNEFVAGETPFHYPTGWHPISLFQDKQDSYWIACDSGLVKYNPRNKTLSYRDHNADHDEVIDVYKNVMSASLPYHDSKGRFWLFSWPMNGLPALYSYDLATKKIKEWEKSMFETLHVYHELYRINELKDGSIWLIGNNVFMQLDESSQVLEPIKSNGSTEFGVRYDAVRHLFEDREHNLWVSTNKGLYRFNPSAQLIHTIYNRFAGRDTIFTPDVQDIFQTKSGDILVGTWGSGIFSYDKDLTPVKLDYVEAGKKIFEGLTWCIYERPNGDIWRGNQGGYLFIYHKNKKSTEKIQPEAFEKSTIRQMVEDNKGDLWFGTQSGKLCKWDAATNSFSMQQDFRSRVKRLYADNKGSIWACTISNGLFKVNSADGTVAEHYTNEGPAGKKLLNAGVSDIIQYNDSLMIIASWQLNILNTRTNTISYFTTKDGLPAAAIVNIVKDRYNLLWLATENGLCSVNLPKKIVSFYNERDGIQSVSFNEGSGALLNDGRVAFGTTHEFIVLDPDQVAKKDLVYPPPATITGFCVMNKWLQVDSLIKLKQVELEYDQNSVVIEFSTLTYQDNFGLYYQLEGLQHDWQTALQPNQAVYSFLPPGNYTFKVRSINANGLYSKETLELRIKIKPPFWKTWWFYCILLLVLGLLFYWLDRQRTKRKEAIQKMRSDIAGNLHNDVNTALNNINILSEIAKMKADKEPEKSIEYIEQINSKSHEMIIAMDDMLWSIAPENDSMKKTVERMKEYIDALKNRHNVHINLTVEEKVEKLELNMKLRHESFQLFKLAIRGLVDTGAGNCQLYIGLEKSLLLFSIQFDNAHCDMQQLNNMLQRPDMKARLNAIAGTLDVQVHKSNSVFLIEVPV